MAVAREERALPHNMDSTNAESVSFSVSDGFPGSLDNL
jgi:hypothetical protein